jgi:hypothetical protein
MWGVVYGLWTYRNEILLGAQLLASLRQTARQAAREYVRRRVAAQLRRSLLAIGGQLAILGLAWGLETRFGGLPLRLLASGALWVVTLYNVVAWLRSALPEMRAVRRSLRGKPGYAFRYVLEVGIAVELMRWNFLLPALCLLLDLSGGGGPGGSFAYLGPWRELWR